MLCRINRTVLTTCASKANHQVCETTIQIALYGSIDDFINGIKEGSYFTLFFQESNDGFIQSGEMIVSFVFTRVINGPAVEYKSAAIAGGIVGYSFFCMQSS